MESEAVTLLERSLRSAPLLMDYRIGAHQYQHRIRPDIIVNSISERTVVNTASERTNFVVEPLYYLV